MKPYDRDNLPPLLFTHQDTEDGPASLRQWPADRPASDDEADQGDDGDAPTEEPAEGEAGSSENRGKSSSSHPLRDWKDDSDDEDEVMVLELIDARPLSTVPPAAGQAARSRSPARHSWAPPSAGRPRNPPDRWGQRALLKFTKASASSAPTDTLSPPPPKRRESTPTPTTFPLPSVAWAPPPEPTPTALGACSGDQGELTRAEEQRAARREGTIQTTLEEIPGRSRPEVVAPRGADGGDGVQDMDVQMGGAGSGQPTGSERVVTPPAAPTVTKTSEPAATKAPEPAKAKTPANSTSSLGSLGQLQQEWANANLNEVSSSQGGGSLGPVVTQALFNNLKAFITGAAKESLALMYHVEKSVAECNDKRVAMFHRAVDSYQKLLKCCQLTVAAPDPAEFRELKEELARAQTCLDEAVPLSELLKQLGERDTKHGEVVKGFESQLQALQEEVARLRKREEDLKASHQAELESL
ncbi:hypothetical protein ACQ4PT_015108 [Festuca glaucescens]